MLCAIADAFLVLGLVDLLGYLREYRVAAHGASGAEGRLQDPAEGQGRAGLLLAPCGVPGVDPFPTREELVRW